MDEQIFILSRIGSTREALNLITEDQMDIHRAIEFCKEHDDPDLWKDLVGKSLDRSVLVQCSGQ